MVKSNKSQQEAASTVISRARELLALKEQSEGKSIQLSEVAEATGLDLHTISRWMKPKPLARIEVKSAVAMAEYFEVEFGDLFVHNRSIRRQ